MPPGAYVDSSQNQSARGEEPAQKGASVINKREENQLLQRLNNDMAAMHGRIAKIQTELIEYFNLRLNDYGTIGQINNIRIQLGNYTQLEDFFALKEAVSLLPADISAVSGREAEHFTELCNHISQLQTAISTKVDGELYDAQRSDLKDFFSDQLAKSRKQETALATKLATVERDLKGAEIEIKRLHEDL
jgi:hypothetical protein